MNPHDWYVENRPGYVARALEPAEEGRFQEHLARCEDCIREVAHLERDLAWLPMATRPVTPSPRLTRRIAAAILDRPSRWRTLAPLAAAAAAVVFAGVVGWESNNRRVALENRLAGREQRLIALEDTLSVLRRAQYITQANIAMDGHNGGLLIFQDHTSHRWCVVVHGLPPAPSGNVYQFWFITTGGMVRSVEVNPDTARPAFATVPMPGVAAPVMGAALTMEPMVNRSSEPRGVQLAHVTF